MTSKFLTALVSAESKLSGIKEATFTDYVAAYNDGSVAFWQAAKHVEPSTTTAVSNDTVDLIKKLAKKEGVVWSPSDSTVSRYRTFKLHTVASLAAFKLACAKFPTFSTESGKWSSKAQPLEIGRYVSFINQFEKKWWTPAGALTELGKRELKAKAVKQAAKRAARLTTYDFATEGMSGVARVVQLRKQLHDLTALIASETAALSDTDAKLVGQQFGQAVAAAVKPA